MSYLAHNKSNVNAVITPLLTLLEDVPVDPVIFPQDEREFNSVLVVEAYLEKIVRSKVVAILAQLAEEGNAVEVVAAVSDRLGCGSNFVRFRAIFLLTELAEIRRVAFATPKMIKAVADCLTDQCDSVRIQAAIFLRAFADKDQDDAMVIAKGMVGPGLSFLSYTEVIEVLAELAEKGNRKMFRAVVAHLNDERLSLNWSHLNFPALKNAVGALAQLVEKGDAGLVAAVSNCLKDEPSEYVRTRSWFVLSAEARASMWFVSAEARKALSQLPEKLGSDAVTAVIVALLDGL